MTIEQLDSARQCKWIANNWAHLSIVNFHENPFGGEAMYQGAEPQSRVYLRDCVLGYQMFLVVYFTAEAATVFNDLVQWLGDVNIHRDRRFDAEFIRARIDRMLVDFWSEVRFAGPQSPRFKHLSFANDGEIWDIFHAYEADLLLRLMNDPYPHPVFYHQAGGEYWKISNETPKGSQSGGSPRQQKGSNPICPYHMFNLLQVTKADGTICGACTRGSNCQHPHVPLGSITMAQALQSTTGTQVGQQTMASALQRIAAEQAVFKP